MNRLQYLSHGAPLYGFRGLQQNASFFAVQNMRMMRPTVANLRVMRTTDLHYRIIALKAVPDSKSSTGGSGSEMEPQESNKMNGSRVESEKSNKTGGSEMELDKSDKTGGSEMELDKSDKTGGSEAETEKSDEYSQNMTQAMGAVLTYRHELGMNYDFILPDLIVGSCLQTSEDVDKLRSIGVKTVFCLQQNPDLEYFGVDINSIQEHAKTYDDIQHLRAEIRDFDAFDLRLRLPAVISQLYRAVSTNDGITYIHCTAGLGRAPAVALAYMFWVKGYKLNDACNLLLSKRSCFPKVEAIKSATADILTGLKRKLVTLTWKGDTCRTVEVSGLDIGWTQKMPLKYDAEQGLWILRKELPEGQYEYKYIVDGEWTCNENELVTSPNKDGHVNNYVKVLHDNEDSANAAVRERLTSDDPDLTKEEREKIIQLLKSFSMNEK